MDRLDFISARLEKDSIVTNVFLNRADEPDQIEKFIRRLVEANYEVTLTEIGDFKSTYRDRPLDEMVRAQLIIREFYFGRK